MDERYLESIVCILNRVEAPPVPKGRNARVHAHTYSRIKTRLSSSMHRYGSGAIISFN